MSPYKQPASRPIVCQTFTIQSLLSNPSQIIIIIIIADEVLAVEDSGVSTHQQHGPDPGLAEPLDGADLHGDLHRVHGRGPPRSAVMTSP